MLWLVSGASVWLVGAFSLRWLLRPHVSHNDIEYNILPSRAHLRVVSVCWPVVGVWLAYKGLRRVCIVSREEAIKTVADFRTVWELERRSMRLLAPPKVKDQFDRDAQQEVDSIVPEV